MVSFKEFLSSAVNDSKIAFNRMQQLTNESIGLADKTKLDSEFENLLERVDKCKLWTERLISGVNNLNSPNIAKKIENAFNETFNQPINKSTPFSEFSNTLYGAAADFGAETKYSQMLWKASSSFKELDTVYKDFNSKKDNDFVKPMFDFIRNQISQAREEKRKLNLLRIDLDSVKNKLKNCSSDKAAETLAQKRQLESDFEFQVNKTRTLLKGISEDDGLHARSFKLLISNMMEYHKECMEILQSLDKNLSEISSS